MSVIFISVHTLRKHSKSLANALLFLEKLLVNISREKTSADWNPVNSL